MIRNIVLFLTLALTTSVLGQNNLEVVLKGQIFNSKSDSITILKNLGNNKNQQITAISLDEKGFYEKTISVPAVDYYIFAMNENQRINFVIEDKTDTIKIYGNGSNLFFESNIVGSNASSQLNYFFRRSALYKRQLDSANTYLQNNLDKKKQVQAAFQNTYKTFKTERQRFITKNSKSPALLSVLPTFDVENEFPAYEKVVQSLSTNYSKSPTVQRIVKEYKDNKGKVKSKMPIQPGTEVEEIAFPNPKGDTMRLSDYKGKVVLIDFWASWCGPCRKSNPHVVNLYKKYKDQGFEVFSVSLDKNKSRWEAAIKQDNLTWDGHVSDLKGWQSAAAAAYNVHSIPFTVLIDREGKVIGSKLRGADLSAALEKVFGK